MYATEQTIDNVLNGTEEAEKLFIQLKEEKLRTRELENENMRLSEENTSLAEVVDFINMYDDESDLVYAFSLSRSLLNGVRSISRKSIN